MEWLWRRTIYIPLSSSLLLYLLQYFSVTGATTTKKRTGSVASARFVHKNQKRTLWCGGRSSCIPPTHLCPISNNRIFFFLRKFIFTCQRIRRSQLKIRSIDLSHFDRRVTMTQRNIFILSLLLDEPFFFFYYYAL